MGTRSRATIVLTTAVLLLALTGCAPDRTLGPTSEPTDTVSTPTGTPTAGPTATATAEPTGGPITITCAQLITDAQMYEYDQNFAADAAYSPAAGSEAQLAVSLDGITCSWLQLSGGDTITVSVADLSADDLADRAAAAASGTPTAAYGGDGFFRLDGATGHAEVFVGSYWLVATSTYFFTAEDAVPIVQAALANLPA